MGEFLKRTKYQHEKRMTTEPNEKHIERLMELMDLTDKGGTSNVPGRKLDLKNNKKLEGDEISHTGLASAWPCKLPRTGRTASTVRRSWPAISRNRGIVTLRT